jgi:lipocalin-like protein
MKLGRHECALLLTIGASLGLSIGSASAQQKSLKEALVGAWSIVSVTDVDDKGQNTNAWGGPVHGQIQLGRTGRFSQILVGQPVASMKQDDPRKPDALIVAYYGTYTVDEASKKVNLSIEGAGYSGRVDKPQTWTVEGSGDKLTLIGSPRTDQRGTFTPHLEIKRP